MKTEKLVRKSHCVVCGKRLSEKTLSGSIQWQPSHVDDKGLCCTACRKPEEPGKEKKGGRT